MDVADWTPAEIMALRRRMGLSQRAFAKLAQAHYNTVNAWEFGRSPPDRPHRIALDTLDREQNSRHPSGD